MQKKMFNPDWTFHTRIFAVTGTPKLAFVYLLWLWWCYIYLYMPCSTSQTQSHIICSNFSDETTELKNLPCLWKSISYFVLRGSSDLMILLHCFLAYCTMFHLDQFYEYFCLIRIFMFLVLEFLRRKNFWGWNKTY